MRWATSSPGVAEPAKPPGRIMLAAHMDEIGLIVTKVERGLPARGHDRRGGSPLRPGPGGHRLPHRPRRGALPGRPARLHRQPAAARAVGRPSARRSIPLRDLRVDLGLPAELLRRRARAGGRPGRDPRPVHRAARRPGGDQGAGQPGQRGGDAGRAGLPGGHAPHLGRLRGGHRAGGDRAARRDHQRVRAGARPGASRST